MQIKRLLAFGIAILLIGFVFYQVTKAQGVHYIFQNLDQFEVQTINYEEKLQFKLTTEEILSGLDLPLEIAEVENTNIDLVKIIERENSLSNKDEVIIMLSLKSRYNSPKGTMLTLPRLNEDRTFTTGLIEVNAYDEQGKPGHFGKSEGSYEEDGYQEHIGYFFEKEELMLSKEWLFEVSGLRLVMYKQK
ncbi:hypothetical protein IM538_13035 [Cytobacillus suaedae]|nr:hypothetical protein IM538_13035 [Cytobacillus suaedae]